MDRVLKYNLNINRSSDVLIELDRKLIEQPKKSSTQHTTGK